MQFGRLMFIGAQKAARTARVRTAFIAAAHHVVLRRAARARSARRIAGLVMIARARARRSMRAVRPGTVLATVWSLHQREFPPRRTEKAIRTDIRRPRLISAARLGPVTDEFLRKLHGDAVG